MFSVHYFREYGIKVTAKFYIRLWWKYMPGTTIKVRWPTGVQQLDKFPNIYFSKGSDYLSSADPNDHYRPWLEENVGRQGWDWDWALQDNDVRDNTLTIKFRFGKKQHATTCALMWT